MPKKKAQIMRKPTALLPSGLLAGLRNAAALMERKRAPEAIALLEELDLRYPNRVEVLTELVNAAYDIKDMQLYERAGYALLKLTPNNPELAIAVVGVHSNNGRLALASLTAPDFLTRWPDYPLDEQAKEMIEQIHKLLPEYLTGIRLAGPDQMELAALHEKTQMLLESGHYREARQTAKKLLDRHPNYAPVLNNISQSYYAEGNIDNAIVTARGVLDFEPDNVHALCNLTHFAMITGFPKRQRSSPNRSRPAKPKPTRNT